MAFWYPRALRRGVRGSLRWISRLDPAPPAPVPQFRAFRVEPRAAAADSAGHERLALHGDLVEELEEFGVVRADVVVHELVEHDEDDVLVVEPVALVVLAELEADALAHVEVVAHPVALLGLHLAELGHLPPALPHDGLDLPGGLLQHLPRACIVGTAQGLDLPDLARRRALRGLRKPRAHRAQGRDRERDLTTTEKPPLGGANFRTAPKTKNKNQISVTDP